MSYGGVNERTEMLQSTKDTPAERRGAGYSYTMKETGLLIIVIQLAVFCIFQAWGHIDVMSDELQEGVGNQNLSKFSVLYNMFLGVLVMMLIGFGYLMTFLKRYGMSALGFTLIVTCISLQWGVISEAGWNMYSSGDYGTFEVHLPALINGLFAAAALLISFGAVIGKVSPMQLIIMAVIEILFYTFNKVVLLENYVGLADDGGTIIIHMFGAFFGLGCAYSLGKPGSSSLNKSLYHLTFTEDSEASNVSDLFSMIGTLFLWIYWPSFVAGPLIADAATQQRAVVNTVLSLTASTMMAFAVSIFFSDTHKFRPVDIQNATLAGGVSIGCVASLSLSGGDAILIGMLAGTVSATGFNKIQGMLDDWGLHDSCGVNNLHGMPSILGGIFSAIFAYHKGPLGHDAPAVYWGPDVSNQGTNQLLGIVLTLVVSIVTGIFTGAFIKIFRPENTADFVDCEWWEVAEVPYVADKLDKVALRVDALDGNKGR